MRVVLSLGKSLKVGCDNIQNFSIISLQLLDNYKLAIPPVAPILFFTLLTSSEMV
jgi:hypothetical protein